MKAFIILAQEDMVEINYCLYLKLKYLYFGLVEFYVAKRKGYILWSQNCTISIEYGV